MLLSDLVGGLHTAGIEVERRGDVVVRGIGHRSGAVSPGDLFCCVRGSRVDGHDLAPVAVDAGAAALVVETFLPVDVPQVRVPDVRRAMGPLATRFHGDPSRDMTVIGVTGTNGKTTTVAMLRSIFEAAGKRCEVLGTLTSVPGGPPTTPDAPELAAQLAEWRDAGVDFVAMEVSSHALDMGRVDGTWFATTIFTNLGRDHLDRHGDVEHYFAAKASLFRADRTDRAVVCTDDEWGRRLAETLAGQSTDDGSGSVAVRTYGVDDAVGLRGVAGGEAFTWRGNDAMVPLLGHHNVANAIAAATCADWIGVPAADIVRGLARTPPVRGRFELVDGGQDFLVAVDYAHTPDALDAVLRAARERARPDGGRVIVVFGCGGDRDRDKRPEMGAAAAASADVVIVTSDNPRSEDPLRIVDEIVAGTADGDAEIVVLVDRAEAIHHAVGVARDHDVVIVAGKGHETTQTFADRVVDFDDRAVARAALVEVVGR